MILGLHWRASDTVITVAQDLNSQLVVLLRQPVEACKQFVEHLHQIGGRVLGRDGREAHNVGVQDAAGREEHSLLNVLLNPLILSHA